MHKQGCPSYNSPYAHCECAAMEQREHTEELRRLNDNLRTITEMGNSPARDALIALMEIILNGEYSDDRALELIKKGLQ